MGENIAGTSCCRWRPMRARRGQVFIWWCCELVRRRQRAWRALWEVKWCLNFDHVWRWPPSSRQYDRRQKSQGPAPSCKDFTLQSLGQALQWLIPPRDPAHQRLPPLLKSPAWKIKRGHWGGWGRWGASMLKCLCLYVSLCMCVCMGDIVFTVCET